MGDDRRYLIKFSDVNSRECAKLYTNAVLGVPRNNLHPLDQDEYYWADLVNMNVINRQGFQFGRVKNIIETGSNAVLCCKKAQNTTMIPFLKSYINQVNHKEKQIIVNWEDDY